MGSITFWPRQGKIDHKVCGQGTSALLWREEKTMRLLPVVMFGLMSALMLSPAAAQIAVRPPTLPPPPSAPAPAWAMVNGQGLGFIAGFPGNAVRKDEVRPTLVGPEQRTTFTLVQASGNILSVLQDDYSKTGGAQANPQALVDSALNGALRNAGGTILSEAQIPVEGGAGRETLISTGGLFARFRYYFVWPRLYQVTAVTRDKDGQRLLVTGDFARFFDSFKLAGK
jgi:hypothetical protein